MRLRQPVMVIGTRARFAARRAQKFALSRYECTMSGFSRRMMSVRRSSAQVHSPHPELVRGLPGRAASVEEDLIGVVHAQHRFEARRQLVDERQDLSLGAPLLEVGDEIQYFGARHVSAEGCKNGVLAAPAGGTYKLADDRRLGLLSRLRQVNARHIRTLRRLRPRAVIGVASRDEGRARDFGARVGARDCFGSYDQAIHRSSTRS